MTAADLIMNKTAAAQTRRSVGQEIPTFQPDPSWPKLPGKWALGQVSDVTVDADDHVWVLHRPRTVKPEEKSRVAPPVLEFDAAGTFIQGWGGPADGYEWPDTEHGIHVDHKGFVWLGGSGNTDAHVLKFTKTGKFVMQIGRRGQSKGNSDTKNLNRATDVFVYPKTNELFVADGYGNRRVIVFDADTGVFKRMWGAFGKPPTDPAPGEERTWRIGWVPGPEGPDESPNGLPQFTQAHAARVSRDGLVYVADGPSKRFQVFTIEGKFVAQVFINRSKKISNTQFTDEQDRLTFQELARPLKDVQDNLYNHHETVGRLALSSDPEQRFLYVMERELEKILVLDRKTLKILGSFGDGPGIDPGQFYVIHDIAVDSHGNVYAAENRDRRVQKLVFKGMVSPGTN
jgi:DNA-binding beta-propeller fold protein YncE